jgi:hypothetical protein
MSGDSELLKKKFSQVYGSVYINKPTSSRSVSYPSLVLLFLTPLEPQLFGVDIKQAYVGLKGSLFGCAEKEGEGEQGRSNVDGTYRLI